MLCFRYFHRGMELLENMRSYFDGLAGELQQVLVQAILQLRLNKYGALQYVAHGKRERVTFSI